ncbi:MAG: FAD-dependent 5-carboxymethylaminomethyl-2-thiouridine(34) oxidoreductase MnmC [Alphaproteobacteria bacterium]
MKKIAIIGGGLAGTACAYVLKQRGFEPVIYESSSTLAPGASGNEMGLCNPRLSAEQNTDNAYFMAAFDLALETFPQLEDIGWSPDGSLHLLTNEKRQQRFKKAAPHWGGRARLVNREEASQIAGVPVEYDALYLPRAGTVSPRKLCAAYAKDIEVVYSTPIENLADIKADFIILACGMQVKNFHESVHLDLKPVRGQVTEIAALPQSSALKCNLCFSGYITPVQAGTHMIGATFQRWLDHSDILPEDDARNLELLFAAVPALTGKYTVTGHRAAVRTTSPDHRPVVSALTDHIYVSTAHGSHGILSSLMAAHKIAHMISTFS